MDRIEVEYLSRDASPPGSDRYSPLLRLDLEAIERLRAVLNADASNGERLADRLFDHVLATEPLRKLLAEGQWDGRMPQFECGNLGQLLDGKPARESGLRQAGHQLRRSGLTPGWILAAYGHHLGALIDALGGQSADLPAAQAQNARDLVQAALADAAQVLDAYVESQAERAARAERQLFTMFEAMPAGVLVLDGELRVLRANRAFGTLFGWANSREIVLRAVEDATGIAALPALVDGVLVSGNKVQDYLLFRSSAEGQHVYTCDIEPLADLSGAAALVMLRDVTEAREENRRLMATLESRVAERTAALAAANRDLEAFSDSVTHDLRAPLRSISGFAKALETRYGSSLDALGQGYLQKVGKAVNRMDGLIEDLLRLAKVGATPLALASVDLAALAGEILHRLAAAEPERRVHWHIARLPLVQADRGWMAIALENLLTNAWKFTGENGLAHIRLGVEEETGKPPVFVVSDNGLGFAAEDVEHLFQPFSRLYDAERYPGHGIGLAIVARIIERHGGTISASSRPGEGASFRFSLGIQAGPEICRE